MLHKVSIFFYHLLFIEKKLLYKYVLKYKYSFFEQNCPEITTIC